MSRFDFLLTLTKKEIKFYKTVVRRLRSTCSVSRGCLLVSSWTRGYPKISIYSDRLKSRKLITVSSFICFVNDKLNSKSGYDISHLCGHKNCILFEHLSFEPHSINLGRVSCHRSRGMHRRCSGHQECRNEEHIVYPNCIL